MIYLYTFCVFINRFSQEELKNALSCLVSSLNKTNKYELHIFTNIDISSYASTNIIIHEYFDNSQHIYDDKWLNLSFNKIHIYKFLFDTYDIDFTWIDLDTIVVDNIEYIQELPCAFIDIGGNNKDPNLLLTNTDIHIPRELWIQGNFWKINKRLYTIFIELNTAKNKQGQFFCYDLQSIYTYYFYYVLQCENDNLLRNGIYIIGRNYKTTVLNGLAIWNENGNKHPNMDGLSNLYYEEGKMKSHLYPENEIHFLSFTFYTLNQLIQTTKFIELFGT